MDPGQAPSTPVRQTPSSSNAPHRPMSPSPHRDVVQATQSTPAADSQLQGPAPSSSGEPSFNTSSSGDGSIVIHSLSDQTSGSGIESSFEALQLVDAQQGSTDSSLEIIVHSSPATTGFLAFAQPQGAQVVPSTPVSATQQSSGGGGGAAKDSRHSRQSSLVAIDEKKALAILSPVAQAFAPPPNASRSTGMRTFEEIVASGKDEWGQLTSRAKEALRRLGLKPIPSLHGPLSLPYARCASGIDAFIPSNDADENPWGEEEYEEGGQARQRTTPIPLPGNSRYTQAGRLAMRYSSAPAALESAAKGTSVASTSSPRRPPPIIVPKSKKPSPSPSRPPAPAIQPNNAKGKGTHQRGSVSTVPTVQPSSQGGGAAANQFEMDAQAFARAQAMQAYFLQQAQLAQVFGGGQGGTGLLSPQYSGNVTPTPALNLGLPRAQSPFLPPFQPFTPPITQASLPSGSQNYFDNPNQQVDSLTLLKLAGQRQLGMNPLQYPIPQINVSQQQSYGSEVDTQDSEGYYGGRQAEQAEDFDERVYDRSAVSYTTVKNNTSGGTGYDFLRQGGRQAAGGGGGGGGNSNNKNNNRRNSSSARPDSQQNRPSSQPPKTPHESRRRRSAAPAMPYPGHSHRKTSTSSVVTVNSSTPAGTVPDVRIFSDPSSPPTASLPASRRRRSMVPTGRPLEDLANSQTLASTSDKKNRASPAESSTNWRRPSLPEATPLETPAEQRAPTIASTSTAAPPLAVSLPSSQVEAPPSRGRGRGGRGRKRGNRGASKPSGRGSAGASSTAQNA